MNKKLIRMELVCTEGRMVLNKYLAPIVSESDKKIYIDECNQEFNNFTVFHKFTDLNEILDYSGTNYLRYYYTFIEGESIISEDQIKSSLLNEMIKECNRRIEVLTKWKYFDTEIMEVNNNA